MDKLMAILVQSLLAYTFVVAFILIGAFFIRKTVVHFHGIENKYGYSFYSLVLGMIIVITLYSIIVAKGITINLLIIPLLILLVRDGKQKLSAQKPPVPFAEILQLVVFTVIVLHLFPESEYKQNDSFFYLKIAEALNKTGQENTHHYYNVYSEIFYGTEPYHYFEIWCTALVSRILSSFYNSLLVHRFVVQSVFLTAIILGLYNLLSIIIKEKIKPWHKLFCWSLVFFMPDLLTYFPALSRYLISNIEGNFLERPNFRILYALLIAIVSENIAAVPRNRIICFWLILLAVISFKFAVLILPAIILFILYNAIAGHTQVKEYHWYIPAFAVSFGMFYWLTAVDRLPSIYNTSLSELISETLVHWKFILFSIAASVVYAGVIAAIFLVPLIIIARNKKEILPLLKKNILLVFIALIGLVTARVFFLKDNAYQFLFAAHIIVFIFIWMTGAKLLDKISSKAWLLASLLFASPVIIKLLALDKTPDIFHQNGNFVYKGNKYSQSYINSVTAYFQSHPSVKGVYLADGSSYSDLYYSRRNPNVYFPPVTYIISGKINGNFEVCISDSAAIMTGIRNPIHKDYLKNAIQRSLFYQYRKQFSQLSMEQVRARFIAEYHLSYAIVSGNAAVDFGDERTSTIYNDFNTGERFIIFKP